MRNINAINIELKVASREGKDLSALADRLTEAVAHESGNGDVAAVRRLATALETSEPHTLSVRVALTENTVASPLQESNWDVASRGSFPQFIAPARTPSDDDLSLLAEFTPEEVSPRSARTGMFVFVSPAATGARSGPDGPQQRPRGADAISARISPIYYGPERVPLWARVHLLRGAKRLWREGRARWMERERGWPQTTGRYLRLTVSVPAVIHSLLAPLSRNAPLTALIGTSLAGVLVGVTAGTLLLRETSYSERLSVSASAAHSQTRFTPAQPSAPLRVQSIAPVIETPGVASRASFTEPATQAGPSVKRETSDRPIRRPVVGSLLVESQPSGAKVSINRQPVGVSPLWLPEMSAGSYAIQVNLEGYSVWSRGIYVVTNQQTRIAANMEPDR